MNDEQITDRVPIAAADAAAAVAEGRACPDCWAPLDDPQTYCIRCGAPTALAPSPHPRRRTRDLVGVGIVVALLAGTIGYAIGLSTFRPVPAADAPPNDTAPAVDTAPTEVTSETAATSTPSEDATRTATEQGITASDWPGGRTGWTVILASVRTENEARQLAERARRPGTISGVLYSSDHPNLRPGYYVVFSGVLNSHQEAAAHVANFRATFPEAYPVQIQA